MRGIGDVALWRPAHGALAAFGLAVAILLASLGPAAAARHALVIGNDGYKHIDVLNNAANDARAVAAALERVGYEVILGLDASEPEMGRLLSQLVGRIETDDEVVFYYAGHGVELAGRNYLLPVDFPRLTSADEVIIETSAIGLDLILRRLSESRARLRVVILDACRENPLVAETGRNIGGSSGLADVRGPEGTFILYSADFGQIAHDRLSDEDVTSNSVYTRALLPLIETPGLSLVDLARRVRRDVEIMAREAKLQQRPTYYDGVTEDYFFIEEVPPVVIEEAPPVVADVEDLPVDDTTGADVALLPGVGAHVQLASTLSQADAEARLRALTSRFGNLFDGVTPVVQRVDLGERGIRFRVLLPAQTLDSATQICASIKASGGDCFAANRELPVAPSPEANTTADVASVDASAVAGSQSLLLEASADGSTGAVPFSGTVEWTRGVDEEGQPTLIGQANIPTRNLRVDLLIRKNAEPNLPASHLIEVNFRVADSFVGGAVAGLPGVLLKNEELVQGIPLVGASARVVGNSFLFALSNSPEDRSKNSTLLATRKWIDLALIYATGKRAIITLEKDQAAMGMFAEVVATWDAAL